jgi:hypothetical protein
VSKSDPTQQALERLAALRTTADSTTLARELSAYIGNRSNLVIAKAAKIAREEGISALVPELVRAFEKLMRDPARLDKRCAALTEIAAALYEMDYGEPDLYLQGMRHVQMEGSFGPPVDVAAGLRGICAQGLVRTRHPQALAEVVSLLVDAQAPARLGAVRALATNGGEAGVLVLRLKALMGDADPEVIAECFSGLLAADRDHSVDFVAGYIEADDADVSEAAILALGASRLPKAIAVLKDKWERTLRGSMRKTLLLALATSRDEGALDFLVSLLDSASVETSSNIIAALAVHKNSDRIRQAVSAAVDRRQERVLVDAFRREFAD